MPLCQVTITLFTVDGFEVGVAYVNHLTLIKLPSDIFHIRNQVYPSREIPHETMLAANRFLSAGVCLIASYRKRRLSFFKTTEIRLTDLYLKAFRLQTLMCIGTTIEVDKHSYTNFSV